MTVAGMTGFRFGAGDISGIGCEIGAYQSLNIHYNNPIQVRINI